MNIITGKDWKYAIISAANSMDSKKNAINAMNIFPVPDGDTGSNMFMTIQAAKEALMQLSDEASISEVAETTSKNMLLSARGNSGVILSQIFKGFTLAFENKKTINCFELVDAFDKATKIAYKAVLKPVEGTILTVIRETSEGLKNKILPSTDFVEFFDITLKLARKSCDNTPELLPLLKEAGVNDSGAEGLVAILEGMSAFFHGKPITESLNSNQNNSIIMNDEIYSGEFGYCTEFILDLDKPNKFDKVELIKKFEKIGNSTIVVQDNSLLKVHIHAVKPGNVLNAVNNLGQFVKIKIENMTIQANTRMNENNKSISENGDHKKKSEKSFSKKCGLISCNTGAGLISTIKEMGVDYVIEGGQTNNPSTKDIISAIDSVDAKTIFILPNNSNIILSAQQAATIINNKKVLILPTKSQAQTIPMVMYFSSDNSEKENFAQMKEILKQVKFGEVAPSVKNIKLDGIKIQKGDFMSLVNNKIIDTAKDYNQAAIKIIEKLVDENTELLNIIYGQDVSKADLDELVNYLEINYDITIETYEGGQAIYPYFISVL